MCSRYTDNKDEAKLKLRDQILLFGFVPRGDILHPPQRITMIEDFTPLAWAKAKANGREGSLSNLNIAQI